MQLLTYFHKFLVLFSTLIFLQNSFADANKSRILLFDSNLTIGKDLNRNVTEIISVHFDGKPPKTFQRFLNGNMRFMNYTIDQVLVNAVKANYKIDGDQLVIINPKMVAKDNIYSYTIKYHTETLFGNAGTNTAKFIWEVTNSQWNYLIAQVQAEIQIPQDAKISSYKIFAGNNSAPNSGVIANVLNGNHLSVATTKPLQPHEGLTVFLGW